MSDSNEIRQLRLEIAQINKNMENLMNMLLEMHNDQGSMLAKIETHLENIEINTEKVKK